MQKATLSFYIYLQIKNNNNIMKHLTSFNKFNLIKEDVENDEGYSLEDLYQRGAEHITDAANLLASEGTNDWDDFNNSDPSDVIEKLEELGGEEAQDIINQIKDVESQIADFPEEDDDDDDDDDDD